jgi:hypothetical protein
MSQRNLDYPLENLLSNLKADIALYAYGRASDDPIDALHEIHKILEELCRQKK